jgi:hypothetical protein
MKKKFQNIGTRISAIVRHTVWLRESIACARATRHGRYNKILNATCMQTEEIMRKAYIIYKNNEINNNQYNYYATY